MNNGIYLSLLDLGRFDTLKRYAFRDEFLIEGVHWRRGPHPTSPITWAACNGRGSRRYCTTNSTKAQMNTG